MSSYLDVTITASEPYVLVAGGWTGMRPVGLRRTYRATVNGTHYENTSKSAIQRVIRQKNYPTPIRFVFRNGTDN
jgi:hypothetical protein